MSAAPSSSKRRAASAGFASYTVARFMSPWRRRTTKPSLRSIDGITVKLSNTRRVSDEMLGQRALGRENAGEPRFRRGRLVHRAGQRLEGGLDDVMRIAAADQVEMQVHPDLVGQRLH